MAPSPIPDPVTLPPAEAGVTTSEFQGLVAVSVVLVGALISVLADFGVNFTAQQKVDVVALVSALLTTGWTAYGLWRNWRKKGTPG